MPISLTIPNLDKLTAEIKAYPEDIEKIINNEFKAFAISTANDAKVFAPVNEGALRESINFFTDNLTVSVGAYIEYAAYLEFGTKSFAEAYVSSLPEEWQVYAAEFKGGAGEGTFDDLLRAIMKWVQLKGIATGKDIDQAAYLISLKIIRQGIQAQPFLYPAYEKNRIELIENLKAQLNVK